MGRDESGKSRDESATGWDESAAITGQLCAPTDNKHSGDVNAGRNGSLERGNLGSQMMSNGPVTVHSPVGPFLRQLFAGTHADRRADGIAVVPASLLERVCRGIYLYPVPDYPTGHLLFHAAARLRACYGSSRLSEALDFTGGSNFRRSELAELTTILTDRLKSRFAVCRCFLGSCLSCSSTSWIHETCGPSTGCSRFAFRRYPGGSTCASIFPSVRQLMPYSWHAARFDNSPVKTRRRTSVHISIAAYTPRASLSVGGYRGSAAILLTDTAAQLCAALFDRPAYPAPRCTFRPAFTSVTHPSRLRR